MNKQIYHVEMVEHHYEDEKGEIQECAAERVLSRTVGMTLEGAFYQRLSQHATIRREQNLDFLSSHIVKEQGDRF